MIASFGAKAEFLAGDRLDTALLAGDAEAYDKWCLVAKAIALMTRHNSTSVAAKPTSESFETATGASDWRAIPFIKRARP